MDNSKSHNGCVGADTILMLDFECQDSINEAKYLIYRESFGDVLVTIDRKLRRRPLVGMKQPTPFGAILGWEGALTTKCRGKPVSYLWDLYRDGKLIQNGQTDENGESSLNLDLPSIINPKYTLHIHIPELD